MASSVPALEAQSPLPALTPAHLSLHHRILLALILLVAAALRWHGVGLQSLSVDELGSMETAAGRGQVHLDLPRDVIISPPPLVATLDHAQPIWEIPRRLNDDVHPPLYYVLLRLWQDLFGGGDVASRSLSVVAGVAGVYLIFEAGRWLADPPTGLWAALLMAVAQPEIIYSQDARPYALVAALALLALAAVARIERLGVNRKRLAALVVGLTGACLTHYFVLPAVLAMGIYALVRLRGAARRQTILAFAAAGVIVLGLWGGGMWGQRLNFSNPWMYWFIDDAPNHVTAIFGRFAALPLRYLAEPPMGSSAVGAGAAVIFLLPWLRVRKNGALLLVAMWLLGCAFLVAAIDLARGTNQLGWIKYTLLAGPAEYLLFPMLYSSGWLKHLLPAAAVIYCLLGLPQAYDNTKADFKGLAAQWDRLQDKHPGSVEPVLFAGVGWGDWYTGGLYMGLERYAKHMPPAILLVKEPVNSDLDRHLRTNHCGLITCWTSVQPSAIAPGWKVENAYRYPGTAIFYELTMPGPVSRE